MTKYHVLTEKLNDASHITGIFNIGTFDKIIREWLREKTINLHHTVGYDSKISLSILEDILELTQEQTLAEKIGDYIKEHAHYDLTRSPDPCEGIAQIAEEHHKENQ